MTDPVRADCQDGVHEIVLAAPERGNAIDLPAAEALAGAVRAVGDDARCVLLRAEGRNFCVGGDVTAFAGDDPGGALRALAGRLHDGLRLLDGLPIPTVAAVHGWAAGAGFSLALAADILLVGPGTRFKAAYNALGLTADGGITWNLPRRVPRAVAMDLLLTDRALTGEEAERLGLASRLLPDDELASGAHALARSLAGGSQNAAVGVKDLVRRGAAADLAAHLDAEAASIAAAAGHPDGREGIAAFVERRAPRFGAR